MSKPFIWHGQELRTYGDIGEAIAALQNAEEGAAFMAAYLESNPHAYANVGYLAGYFDSETQNRIFDLTGAAHPLFGRSHPTPEQAFDLGRRIAEGGAL